MLWLRAAASRRSDNSGTLMRKACGGRAPRVMCSLGGGGGGAPAATPASGACRRTPPSPGRPTCGAAGPQRSQAPGSQVRTCYRPPWRGGAAYCVTCAGWGEAWRAGRRAAHPSAATRASMWTTALTFFSTAHTRTRRPAAAAAARDARMSGPRPAPTTITTVCATTGRCAFASPQSGTSPTPFSSSGRGGILQQQDVDGHNLRMYCVVAAGPKAAA